MKHLIKSAVLTAATAAGAWGIILTPVMVDSNAATADAGTSACIAWNGAQVDYDGTVAMHEDEVPTTGFHGGEIVDFHDGVVTYDDDTATDGTCWYTSATAPELFGGAA